MNPDEVNAFVSKALGRCMQYCSHGGGCTLALDHNGPHQIVDSDDSVRCEWSDSESISRTEADRVLEQTGLHDIVVAHMAYEAALVALMADDDDRRAEECT